MPPSVKDAIETVEERPHRPARVSGALRSLAMEDSRRSFLRMVSHELRTPLNSIIGFSEIISRELHGPISEPRYREHAEMIHQSGLRLLKLVNDVLDIARLEAGAMDLDLRPEQPLTAMDETLVALRDEAAARRVTLTLSAPGAIPAVLADSRGLRTIFLTLVQNAIAHSPLDGEVHVLVQAQGADVVFEISDHGKGVSVEDLARIVKPFEIAENALVRRSEGAGLGLAIVGLLCKAMRGALLVRSNAGEGLTAIVKLPAVDKLSAV